MNLVSRILNTETFFYTLLFILIETIAIAQIVKTGSITVSIGAFVIAILILIGYILHIAIRLDEVVFEDQARKLERRSRY